MLHWLTALLAFAVTMLIFAMIVSTLVETIHRFIGLREKGLQLMLENFYDWVIVKRLKDPQVLTRDKFVNALMTNRAIGGPVLDETPGTSGVNRPTMLMQKISKAQVSDVPVEIAMQRLGELASHFDFVKDEIVEEKERILQDFAQRYVAFGQEASHYFRQRARLLSVVVAICVAIAFNVQPPSLLQFYLKNPEVSSNIAALNDRVLVDVDKLTAELETSPEADDIKDEIAQLKASVERVKQSAEQVSGFGAPIGLPLAERWKIFKPFDAFWLLLGGLLIGLGAPFWASAVSTLTRARSVTRDLSEILSPRTAPGVVGVSAAPARLGESPAIQAFEAAATNERTASS